MDKRADLHIHTTASDGTWTPSYAVEAAASIGLAAIGITDHDTVAGVEEALDAGARHGVEIVPGIEISATHDDGTEVHILGYYIDHTNAELAGFQSMLASARQDRARKMVELLNSAGVAVKWERVAELARGGAIGRPHVAKAICEVGAASSMDAAFGMYIKDDGPFCVPRLVISLEEAIGIIHGASGLACCAHVAKLKRDDLVIRLIDAGISAIEVWHPDHTKTGSQFYEKFACDRGLVATGGSDAHGFDTSRTGTIGEVTVPYDVVEQLKALAL